MADFRASIPIMDAGEERDTTQYCVELEGWFLTTLLGFAGVLALDLAWSGTPEEVAEAVDAVELQMEKLMGIITCNGVASVATSKSGYTKVTYQNGTYNYVANKSAAELAENYPNDQPYFPPGDSVCAGARMLVERILADLNFALQQSKLVLAEFELAVETASGLLNMMAFVGIPIGSIFDPWSEWVFEAGDVGIAVIEVALNDPSVISKMTENIYCGIVENGGHQLTLAIYNDAMNDLPMLESTSSLLAHIFRGFDTTVSEPSYLVAERYYNLGTLNSDNTCAAEFECDEEIFCFDVPFEEPEGVDYNNAAYTLTADGWVNSSNVSTSFVRVDFAENVKIKSITGQAQHTAANNADQAIRLNLGGVEQMRVINENNDAIYGWTEFEDFPTWGDPDGTTVNQVVFQAYADGVGTIQWKNVRICFSYVT
jgi:hypothetical protein